MLFVIVCGIVGGVFFIWMGKILYSTYREPYQTKPSSFPLPYSLTQPKQGDLVCLKSNHNRVMMLDWKIQGECWCSDVPFEGRWGQILVHVGELEVLARNGVQIGVIQAPSPLTLSRRKERR